jgi:hypothetical protein
MMVLSNRSVTQVNENKREKHMRFAAITKCNATVSGINYCCAGLLSCSEKILNLTRVTPVMR